MKFNTLALTALLALGGCLDSMAGTLVNGVYVISNATATVSLAWNRETDPTVVGYRVYQGVASRSYTNMIDVGNSTNVVNFPVPRGVTNYIAATAYTLAGLESDFSAEVTYIDTNTVPAPPGGMKPPVTLVAQQNLGTGWQNVYALSIDPTVAPMSEFRLVMAYNAPPAPAAPAIVPGFKSSVPVPPQPMVLPTSKGKMTIWRATS